jgi:hypothetical protein
VREKLLAGWQPASRTRPLFFTLSGQESERLVLPTRQGSMKKEGSMAKLLPPNLARERKRHFGCRSRLEIVRQVPKTTKTSKNPDPVHKIGTVLLLLVLLLTTIGTAVVVT